MDDDINIIHCEQARLSSSFPPKTLFCFSFHPKNRSRCKGTPNIGHFDVPDSNEIWNNKTQSPTQRKDCHKTQKNTLHFWKISVARIQDWGWWMRKHQSWHVSTVLFKCLACLGKTRGHVTHKSCTYGFYFSAVRQFRWLIMFNKKKELVEARLSYRGRCGGSQWLSDCKHAVWLTKSGVRQFHPFRTPPPFFGAIFLLIYGAGWSS